MTELVPIWVAYLLVKFFSEGESVAEVSVAFLADSLINSSRLASVCTFLAIVPKFHPNQNQ